MMYSNSSLVQYTKLSPNNSGLRTHSIDRISPHCVVGQCSIEGLGNAFANPNYQASSNYGIDKDGRIGLFVPESNRSWCTSSRENDQRAVTIECASDTYHPYRMNEVVFTRLVELCADICKRNGKKKLLWFDSKSTALNYAPKSDEMVITLHRWYANKSCPGDYLYGRMGELAKKVTAKLGGEPIPVQRIYRVQVGAFSKRANADAQLARVKKAGFSDAYVTLGTDNLFRVQVGAYAQKSNADSMLARIKKAGFDAFIK